MQPDIPMLLNICLLNCFLALLMLVFNWRVNRNWFFWL